MKKINKIGVFVLLLVGLFVFKQDVYADWIEGYLAGNIEFNILNEETNQFEKQDITTMYLEENGIIEPWVGSIKKGEDVYVIDNKIILNVPQKEGYYFSGWYLDDNFENSFLDFKVDKAFKDIDLKLYGKWLKEKPTNKTYEFGKDAYIIHISGSCDWWNCGRGSKYIYLSDNETLINEKETLKELPALTTSEYDGNFLGWYQKFEYVHCEEGNWPGGVKFSNRISNLAELISSSEKGYGGVYPKWEKNDEDIDKCKITSSETTTDTTTIGTTDNITDTEDKKDNTLLYIGIGAGIGIVLSVTTIALIMKKKK